jgi:hypothetical protein
MNFPLEGYNECLITYILAASSPTHSIDAETFTKAGQETELILPIKPNTGFHFM